VVEPLRAWKGHGDRTRFRSAGESGRDEDVVFLHRNGGITSDATGCAALSRYLWTINHIVATINIAFTALGAFFYILIIAFATFSYACPYQTPFSVAFRYTIDNSSPFTKPFRYAIHNRTRFARRFTTSFRTGFANLKTTCTQLYRRICAMRRRLTRNEEVLPTNCLALSSSPPTNVSPPNGTIALSPIHDRNTEMKNHALNAACITWILEQSSDMAAVVPTFVGKKAETTYIRCSIFQ
jgi:hypothetical protein